MLSILPDPVVCFADANYSQTQVIELTPSSNLVLLDWLTAGRIALGENWALKKLCSSSKIYIDNVLIVNESVTLSDTPTLTLRESMGEYKALAFCVILGPELAELWRKVLKDLGAVQAYGSKPNPAMFKSASPLCPTAHAEPIGCVVRICASSTAMVYTALQDILQPLFPVLGANP
ncbi:PREDICTED: urease accessory protein D-like, partial [Priapulus caudatus]|uniref:Urease accessory protein D-like n=1 Tax=Priapulus caudatus TaxID=37621 RepID=A0ABM1ED04_PRICU